MRDIRADLRERLELAEAQAKAANEHVKLIKGMLEAEEARIAYSPPLELKFSSASTNALEASLTVADKINADFEASLRNIAALRNSIVNDHKPQLPDLDEFLLKAVRRGVHEKDELRDAAVRAGYFEGRVQSPGRIIHATLLHLVKDGRLQKAGDHFTLLEGVS